MGLVVVAVGAVVVAGGVVVVTGGVVFTGVVIGGVVFVAGGVVVVLLLQADNNKAASKTRATIAIDQYLTFTISVSFFIYFVRSSVHYYK